MNWIIELKSDNHNLEYLLKDFKHKDFTIVYENDQYFLKSEQFEKMDEYQEVKEKVIEVLISVSSVALFLMSVRKLGRPISYLRDDGVLVKCIESGTNTYINCNLNQLVKSDENVRDVFELINYDYRSWITWFKIIEILQKDDFKPVKKGGEYFKNVERLNRMANSYKANGVGSRHHQDSITPPPKLMTEDEGESLIRQIICHWLFQKYNDLVSKTE